MIDIDTAAEAVRLAEQLGVATEYWDQQGNHHRVSDETLVAVLRALDVDVLSAVGIERAWDRITNDPWRRQVPAFTIMTQGAGRPVIVHVPDGSSVNAWVELETGGRIDLRQTDHVVAARDIDGQRIGEAAFLLPEDLPLGYHEVHVRCESLPAERGVLAVAPAFLGVPTSMRSGQQWGLMAQLYATRSESSWGIGDLHDLGELAAWAGRRGGEFVLVNPMHAAEPKPHISPSPYLPTTRRFFNPIYIRIEDVPEYAALSAETRRRVTALATPLLDADRTADLIDRDPIWEAKAQALDLVFAVPLPPARQQAFAAYCDREGAGLELFARWSAFAEEFGTASQLWPEGLRHPRGAAVEQEAVRLAERVTFHKKCQWILDEQFASAQAQAKAAGMAAGVVHDLAVGVHPDGADSWGLQDVLAKRMNVGCPPDMFNQMGQDWSQPPWRPDALVATAYTAYRDMLRTILRHAGGIRVDHALGLFRLWWIPAGCKPYEGTFVKYDHEAFVGILALEAHRAGAFVVGEDLGTVEPWIQHYLAERGILGTSIFWFEYGNDGRLLPPEQYRELCFAAVTVHDLPPSAGMWQGEHVRIREELQLLARPAAEEWGAWEHTKAGILAVLREQGLVAAEDPEPQQLVEALHAYIGRSPARLLAVALPDVVGDIRAQNQPGTDQEYPNWRVPTCDAAGIPVTIEDLSRRADLVERADRLIAALMHRSTR